MGAVVERHESQEVDVIVRRCPGHPDLKEHVGILFIDHWLTGAPSSVTFEPFHERIDNCVIEVASLDDDGSRITIVDKEDGKRWVFEIDDEACE